MNKTSQIIAKIKELFAEEKMAMDYTAATGEIIRCMGDGLRIGEQVKQVIGGVPTELPDGNYLLDNGKSITVSAGAISEINEPKATSGEPNEIYMEKEKEMEMGNYKDRMADYNKEIDTKLMDGTEVKVLSKGDALSVGDEVLVKDAEGNFVKAPAGEHKLEGGLTIYTDERGFINELETEETEKEDAENEEMKTMFEAVSTMKSIVDELKSTIADLKNENKELKERFNKFAAEPSAQTITKKPETLSTGAKKEDKLKFFAYR